MMAMEGCARREGGGLVDGLSGMPRYYGNAERSGCLLSSDLWPMENVRNEERDKRTAK